MAGGCQAPPLVDAAGESGVKWTRGAVREPTPESSQWISFTHLFMLFGDRIAKLRLCSGRSKNVIHQSSSAVLLVRTTPTAD